MDTSSFRAHLLERDRRESRRASLLRAAAAGAIGVVLIGTAYYGSAYLTAWRLFEAARLGDTATLAAGVDWTGLRADLRAELSARLLAEQRRLAAEESGYRAVGAVLAHSTLGTMVDTLVTPNAVAALSRPAEMAAVPAGAAAARAALHSGSFHDIVEGATPTGPTTFRVTIALPQPAVTQQVSLLFAFSDWRWKLTRLHLPPQVQGGAPAAAGPVIALPQPAGTPQG